MTRESRLVVEAEPQLAEVMRDLAQQRMVFFAGLPGTGKSLLVHQLTHLATDAGRSVHLLQWDVARPALEASAAGRRYPLADGVTHPVIRKAAGLWARRALVAWNERYQDPRHLLVGETPFVGNRFVELARRLDDAAEALLTAPSCRFVIAVPSREVRRFLEAERERRAVSPLHPREREDAPPNVLRDLWRDLHDIAREMGIAKSEPDTPDGRGQSADADGPPYDPAVYQRVYETVLRHRHVQALALNTILPTEHLSAYDFAVAVPDLSPTEAEADRLIRDVEHRYPDSATLERDIARWQEGR
jgi:hypothetical protein